MNRPVDPWATAHDPTQPEVSALGPGSTAPYPTVPVAGVGEAARGGAGPMYGRAAVPVAKPQAEASEEMALVAESPRRSVPPKKVSWQRTSSASRRSLSDGWGFTATGLIVAFCGWGIWAAAARVRCGRHRRSRHHAAGSTGAVRPDPVPGVYRDRADAGPAPHPRSVGAPVHGAFPDVRRAWRTSSRPPGSSTGSTGCRSSGSGSDRAVQGNWIGISAVSLAVGWVDQRQTSAMRTR